MPKRGTKSAATTEKTDQAIWENWTKGVEIREIAADAVVLKVDRSRLSAHGTSPVHIQFRLDPTTHDRDRDEVTLGFEFELLMLEEPDDAEAKEPLLRASMTYHATYSLPRKPATTDEFVKRFQERIGVAHVFPFVRAHLADLIMRAGLPPLYLPLAHPASAGK